MDDLSVNPYYPWLCGTCLRTNGHATAGLSKNTYHPHLCGTGLRTNRGAGKSVCPETRTSCCVRGCGTYMGTNTPPFGSVFVHQSVPHPLKKSVVRVCGQTGIRRSQFVQKHVPLPAMWYVSADKWSTRSRFVQKPVPPLAMWYGSADKRLSSADLSKRPAPPPSMEERGAGLSLAWASLTWASRQLGRRWSRRYSSSPVDCW